MLYIRLRVYFNSNSMLLTVLFLCLQCILIVAGHHVPVRLIVFAWKRRASLWRLMQSLDQADYMNRKDIVLDIHLDGDAHELVERYVDSIEWSHGPKLVHRRAKRAGLERLIMGSWSGSQDENDKEVAFMFEDDIEVSPHYFVFAMEMHQKYKSSASLIGVSLNTPRYNEVLDPRYLWTPDDAIDSEFFDDAKENDVFFFQLPSSWGAMYTSKSWWQFREYYEWRMQVKSKVPKVTVPGSMIHHWLRSWKKYLVEYMMLTGSAMVYPNFPNQASLSTHHRELGEHTQAIAAIPQVDQIREMHEDHLTVPLLPISARGLVDQAIERAKKLDQMPVVSFYHKRVANLNMLQDVGLYTRLLMSSLGFRPIPPCILDLKQPSRSITRGSGKLLVLDPHDDTKRKLAMRNGILISRALNRTLVSEWEQPSQDLALLVDRMVMVIPHTNETLTSQEFNGEMSSLTKRSDLSVDANRTIMIGPWMQGIEDIKRLFASCMDEVLVFDQLHDLCYEMTNEISCLWDK